MRALVRSLRPHVRAPQGRILRAFNSDIRLSRSLAVAVGRNDGDMCVADRARNCVQVFRPDGTCVRQ